MRKKTVYIIRRSETCDYGHHFFSRNKTLSMFIRGCVNKKYSTGWRRSGVYEYSLTMNDIEKLKKNNPIECVPVPDDQYLTRIWFFRSIGENVYPYSIAEKIKSSKDRRKNVLHICDVKKSCVSPVFVGHQLTSRYSTWIDRYRRFHWLSNLNRKELKEMSHLILNKRLFFFKRKKTIKRLYKKSSKIDFFMPKHEDVFDFECRGIFKDVFNAKDYIIA